MAEEPPLNDQSDDQEPDPQIAALEAEIAMLEARLGSAATSVKPPGELAAPEPFGVDGIRYDAGMISGQAGSTGGGDGNDTSVLLASNGLPARGTLLSLSAVPLT